MDVGGTSVRAGVVDARGEVLDTARGSTPPTERALEDAICAVVSELTARHRATAVGLAVAGFIANDRRTVMFAPHLAWRDAPVAARVEARLGLPVVLEHDANAAGWAEHRFGALKGVGTGLLLAIGTGIGAALVVDGRLYRGAHGVAPELGHLTLEPGGRPCPCGKRGCWERYCSGTALAATATDLLATRVARGSPLAREEQRNPGSLTGRTVSAAAREGDPLAVAAMAEFARWLATGLSLIADAYDPEVVAIGGGLSEAAPLFLDDAREQFHGLLTGAGHRPPLRLRPAHHRDNAGIIGAAALAAHPTRGLSTA
ncbi:ROK family protein [Actinokineospora bangkokensis]|uniref:Glucokinase n=1 Tax=Actinokineospora bangkokensis TaxID=1193682 RepID=A0A1Q9LT62_9PSEU|nr:ROK family protein [Actinokineospora bangkokensis]OLR95225.1 glucokinase [Actinokineospora bangkokensis]